MNADQQETAFATLQFTGDQLDPCVMTAALDLEPTFSVRKGQVYRHGRREREYVGRTGVWNLSTREMVRSPRLQDHLDFLGGLLSARSERLDEIRTLVRDHGYWAGVSCFWSGPAEAAEPTVAASFRKLVARMGGEIETDFHREDEATGRAAVQ